MTPGNPSTGAPEPPLISADGITNLINKLTPDIKEKAFDPDWFLLRQALLNLEARAVKAEQVLRHVKTPAEDHVNMNQYGMEDGLNKIIGALETV